MKKLSLFISVILVVLTFSSCINNTKKNLTFNAESYGIKMADLSFAGKNTVALNTLINKAKRNATIVFSEGTYYFDSKIEINNVSGINIIGNNTVFINNGYDNSKKINDGSSDFVSITNSKNVLLSGISFDYYAYPNLNGTVLKNESNSLTIKLDDGFSNGENNMHLPIVGGEYAKAVDEFDNNNILVSDTYADSCFITSYDKNNNLYKISGKAGDFANYKIGNQAIVRFSINDSASPVFVLNNVNGLTFKNVNIFSSPSASIFSQGNGSNFNFSGLKIVPRANSCQKWSSNVDGIYLKNQNGYVNLINSEFEGMGDDALNVNSLAGRVAKINNHKLIIDDALETRGSLPKGFIKKSDKLRFFDDDWKLICEAEVKSVGIGGVKLKNITDEDIKALSGCYVQNTRYLPKITIENTTVKFGRARAFLIRSEDVKISNCNIENLGLSGIIVAADLSNWYEMSPSKNVIINNNVFKNCCSFKSQSNCGVIAIKVADDTDRISINNTVHKNISIVENEITNSNSFAIYANAVDGLNILNNKISNTPKDADAFKTKVEIYNSKNINIGKSLNKDLIYFYNCN